MSRPEPPFLVVGRVGKAHGTRGELCIEELTDHPGNVFVAGVVLRPGDRAGAAPDADLPPLRIDAARPFQDGWLVTFGGVADRSTAEMLRGRYLMIERELLPGRIEGEVFYHELVGMQVVTVAGETVGEISAVFERRPADLIEVRTGRGAVLIPFHEPIVRAVDVAGRRVVIDPPAGLLDL